MFEPKSLRALGFIGFFSLSFSLYIYIYTYVHAHILCVCLHVLLGLGHIRLGVSVLKAVRLYYLLHAACCLLDRCLCTACFELPVHCLLRTACFELLKR